MRRKATILVLLLAAFLLTACGRRQEERKYHVVTTIFPAYDWTRQILGDADAELMLLSGKGVDLHSYQVTVADMAAIARCDLFIYVGGESDEWVEEVLASVPNPNRVELSLMEALSGSLWEEEIIEGMQVRVQEEEAAYDEHIWLSLRNAVQCCTAIRDAAAAMDPAGADGYRRNAEEYIGALQELEGRFAEAAASGNRNTLLFADRFPFRYLAEDYGLNCYAAFSGCSGDSEASFATVLFLAEKLEEEELNSVLILEDSDERLAQTIIGCTQRKNQRILVLDSMQAVALEDAGNDYLSRMEHNLEALTGALE